ncbi:MAG: carboxypeptidase-like regulatory domain-containing protein [Prevotella sp.]|nr:carboxypeptidase-like regulatory domain-containing protein [Prevotella sp.]
MNANRILLSSVFLFSCISLLAQERRQRTVVDGDTGLPIARVSITGRDFTITTDSAGHFTLPANCKTLVFSHVNYVSYMANINDLDDRVELYSNDHRLNEVVVFGTPSGKDPLGELNNGLRLNKTDAQLMAANPNGNLLGLLSYLIPKKWRSSKKARRQEELKRILENY